MKLDREKVTALVRKLESATDVEALSTLRFLSRFAAKEKKNLAEFLGAYLAGGGPVPIASRPARPQPARSEDFPDASPDAEFYGRPYRKKPKRAILDALLEAAEAGRHMLSEDDYEFASTMPIEIRFDWQMHEGWRIRARGIIRKVRAADAEPLI